MEQLEDNLGAVGWTLSAEQLARLNTASAQPAPYPHDFIADAQQRR
jgi:aryl-alcohol dehydrogenase-like predicted oxidoreductase